MIEITLVLPFALPPPELAPDLVRALQAPGLAALLSRTSANRALAADSDARALPHELWLGRAIGLCDGRRLAFAAAAMRGFGLDPAGGAWMIVNPAHIEISRTYLMMGDTRRLGLVDSHSRALFDSAKPYFDDSGHTLLYGDAHTWFMRAGAWAALDTASPDATGGMNLTDWLPQGEHALDYRKLQNEVQMLWHQHPANVEREARGWPAINSFWPWGAADAGDMPSAPFACAGSPPWLSAIAQQHGSFAGLLAGADNPALFCDGRLAEAALATDWAGWLQHMQQLDQDTFMPLLDAVTSGRAARARLVLSHRNALAEFTTSAMAQRKFWRRPTLDRLLP
ncbi:hypothetical protein Q4S45_07885 [Massilia sp. R2A-15]|uniref:hypothetical protein n=1 Tax=Massilia sp. R2A-15 TaxID=3064278 RepID=UPI0027369BF6|nr:hypothetical protein [Massilia sp. R2A-15]WLI91027.1 hypothetical protein Q4S45_07885 [Massilia sp. R2A-15]